MTDQIGVQSLAATCKILDSILTDVWNNGQCIENGSEVYNRLKSLYSTLPNCIKDVTNETVFLANPQFAWSLVGILSASLTIGYITYKYIDILSDKCTAEVKEYMKDLLKDVDVYLKQANDNIEEVMSMIKLTKWNMIEVVLKMNEAKDKLEAAEMMLSRGKQRVGDCLKAYEHSSKVGLYSAGIGFVALTVISGLVGYMFPPSKALNRTNGNAAGVGFGTAAAVGVANVCIWVALFSHSTQKITEMEEALLLTWREYDNRIVQHELVKKRFERINSMIVDLSKEDDRIEKLDAFKLFRRG